MAQALKTRSNVRRTMTSARRPAAATQTTTEAFSDPFLGSWIANRLGDTERRLLLILQANSAADTASAVGSVDADQATIIADHGGHAIRPMFVQPAPRCVF